MNILFATDGSSHAEVALNFLLRFPFTRETTMTVLTVVDAIPMIQPELESLDDEQNHALQSANKVLRDDAAALVDRVGDRLREDGWSGSTRVGSGDPVEEILAVADEINADLIVLGSHGTGGIRRFLLGSVSDQVLEYADCSVLIVKEPEPGTMQPVEAGTNTAMRILLAYDHTEASDRALELCADIPLEEGSEISVVSVMPLVTAYRQDIRQHINDIWLHKREVLEDALDNAIRALKWATPNVTSQLREGDSVSDELLTAAEEAGIDMIMVGCKRKTAFKRFLMGSVTHRMARYARCSVWAVREKKNEPV